MKIGEFVLTPPSEEILILPRGKSKIVIKGKAIPDLDEFEKLIPEPKAPGMWVADKFVIDDKDKNFLSVRLAYQAQQNAYVVLKTLEPSKIEWESVKMDDPSTWTNWLKDLRANGMTQREVNLIVQFCFDVNSLNDKKLDEARKSFSDGPATE